MPGKVARECMLTSRGTVYRAGPGLLLGSCLSVPLHNEEQRCAWVHCSKTFEIHSAVKAVEVPNAVTMYNPFSTSLVQPRTLVQLRQW